MLIVGGIPCPKAYRILLRRMWIIDSRKSLGQVPVDDGEDS